jgi:hypothetical protein
LLILPAAALVVPMSEEACGDDVAVKRACATALMKLNEKDKVVAKRKAQEKAVKDELKKIVNEKECKEAERKNRTSKACCCGAECRCIDCNDFCDDRSKLKRASAPAAPAPVRVYYEPFYVAPPLPQGQFIGNNPVRR